MTDRIQCPICQYAHIPRDMDTCPQCDADLTCFRLLDRLSDMPLEPALSSPESATADISAFGDMLAGQEIHPLESNNPADGHQRRVWLALMVLTLVLAGFFIFFTYRLSAVEYLMQQQHTALINLVTSVPSSVKDDPQKKNLVLEPIRKQTLFLDETDPIPDPKKPPLVAIQPILIISEALGTDAGSKAIGIDME